MPEHPLGICCRYGEVYCLPRMIAAQQNSIKYKKDWKRRSAPPLKIPIMVLLLGGVRRISRFGVDGDGEEEVC